jgi:hypothetical protein
MSKTPIKPEDIRKGDLIRFEYANIPGKASEYIAMGDEIPTYNAGHHFLLDRPKPTVDLPTKPTLGFISSGTVPTSTVGMWWVDPNDPSFVIRDGSFRLADDITAFVPATAVPAEALDELRAVASGRRGCPDVAAPGAITTFLAAVDEVSCSWR